MKKYLITYYLILTAIPLYAYYNCMKLINPTYITSAPWTLGLIFPTCYLTFLLILLAILLKVKYKRNQEILIALLIFSIQLIILIANI